MEQLKVVHRSNRHSCSILKAIEAFFGAKRFKFS
jgi:hypothetical protein